MKHIYDGEFTDNQISTETKRLQKQIFFILQCADPETKQNYPAIDIAKALESILYEISGLNELLFNPNEIVVVMSLLQEAHTLFASNSYNFRIFRKLLLDAGSKIKEVSQ